MLQKATHIFRFTRVFSARILHLMKAESHSVHYVTSQQDYSSITVCSATNRSETTCSGHLVNRFLGRKAVCSDRKVRPVRHHLLIARRPSEENHVLRVSIQTPRQCVARTLTPISATAIPLHPTRMCQPRRHTGMQIDIDANAVMCLQDEAQALCSSSKTPRDRVHHCWRGFYYL